jgi:hypothetical protein
MESLKLGSQNPLMQDNKMTQKLVQYGDHNKLYDDVEAIETQLNADVADLQDQIDNLVPTLPAINIKYNTGGFAGEGMLLAIGRNPIVMLFPNILNPTGIAPISVSDLIETIWCDADAVLTYQFGPVGGPYSVASADPTLQSLILDATMIGVVQIDVQVNDTQNLTYTITTCTMYVADIHA